MLLKSDAVHTSWANTDRTLDFKVKIKDVVYTAADITSLSFDSGALNGEALTLGSTYTNTVKITFSHLVEGLEQLDEVVPEIGILLPDATWDFTKLGVFVIDSNVTQDRNNNTTTISTSDRMCMLGGTYTSELNYPAPVNEIAIEIANKAGVTFNNNDFARLPVSKIDSFGSATTYRDAIGYVAQFSGGFATFDRDGLLDIRTLGNPGFSITPGQYQSKGLVKNEAMYRIGGIQATVARNTKDENGNETQTNSALQSGSASGTQITLTNPSMTQEILDGLFEQLQDINFYPFTLSWFGDPSLEAGDWVTLSDLAGNEFQTPMLSYALTFNGSLTATSKADTTVTASATFIYKGGMAQAVENIRQQLNASGHAVSEGIDEPSSPKTGDIWFKKSGSETSILVYSVNPETKLGSWNEKISTKATSDISSQLAELQKNMELEIATSQAASDKANEAVKESSMAQNVASSAQAAAQDAVNQLVELQPTILKAQQDATDALAADTSLLTRVGTLETTSATIKQWQDTTTGTLATLATKTEVDGLNGTVAALQLQTTANANALTTKMTRDDVTQALAGYATQDYVTSTLTQKADQWSLQLTGVQNTVDNMQIGGVNLLTGTRRFDGWALNNGARITAAGESNEVYFEQTTSLPGTADFLKVVIPNSRLKPNQKYAFSFDAAGSGSLSTFIFPGVGLEAADDFRAWQVVWGHNRYKMTFTTLANIGTDDKFVLFRLQAAQTITVSIKEVQLEEGTVATPWSESPLDFVNSLTAMTTKTATLSTTLDQYTQQLTSTTAIANTATTNIQSVQATVNSTSTMLATVKNDVASIAGTATNLVYNSNAELGMDGWTSSKPTKFALGTHAYWYNGQKNFFKLVGGPGINEETYIVSDEFQIKRNTEYLLRFWWVAPFDLSSMDVYWKNNNNNILTGAWNPTSDHGWYTATFNSGENDTAIVRVDANGSETGSSTAAWLGIAEISVTEGTSTHVVWSPSPKDSATITAVNAVKSTVTETTQTIKDIDGRVTQNTTSIDGVRSSVTNQLTNLQTTQTTLAGQYTSIISSMSNPNLIANSGLPTDTSSWSSGDLSLIKHAFYRDGEANLFAIHNVAVGEKTASTDYFQVQRNTTYTLQFLGFASANVSSMDVFYLSRKSGSTASYDNSGVHLLINTRKLSARAAEKVVVQFDSGPFDEGYLRFDNNGSTDGSDSLLAFGEIKVEIGSLATPWEDTPTSSQITQLQDSINLRVTKDGLLSQINLAAGSTLIQTNKLYLDAASVVMGGTAFIKAANIIDVKADSITSGSLSSAITNTIQLNASQITAGVISGTNLSINLGTGEISFSKGEISSTNGALDINVDEGTISQKNIVNGELLAGIMFDKGAISIDYPSSVVGPGNTAVNARTIIGSISAEILSIDAAVSASPAGMTLYGLNSISARYGEAQTVLQAHDGLTDVMADTQLTLYCGTDDGGWGRPLAGSLAEQPIIVVGTSVDVSRYRQYGSYDMAFPTFLPSATTNDKAQPNFTVGKDVWISGQKILLSANTPNRGSKSIPHLTLYSDDTSGILGSMTVYSRTYSNASNVYVTPEGTLGRTTSATKYKTDIQRFDNDYGDRLLNLSTATWIDKAYQAKYVAHPDIYSVPYRNFGMIAEDLANAGLEMLIERTSDGQVEGIQYDRIGPALIPVIRKLKDEITDLQEEIKTLKENIV